MGSAVLNKPPSPFITFVYCFLLISFLFYIPHRIVAEGVGSGASRVDGSRGGGHAPSAVNQGSPPVHNPNSSAVDCGRGGSYTSCLGDPKSKSDETMYNWTEGVPPSHNSERGLYPGRH